MGQADDVREAIEAQDARTWVADVHGAAPGLATAALTAGADPVSGQRPVPPASTCGSSREVMALGALMPAVWSPNELERIDSAEELTIAATRAGGSLRRPVPIWVVCVGAQVYVRTWHRRDTGWFGHVLDSRRARICVPRLEVDVDVEDVGEGTAGLRAGVDAAYRAKYGRYGSASVDRMVTAEAAAATLRLTPATAA